MKAVIKFHSLVQESQVVGSDDKFQNHMVTTMFFTLETGEKGEKVFPGMSVKVRQPYGTDYATDLEIEVLPPDGPYRGNWYHQELNAVVEDYFHRAIGLGGVGIGFGPNVKNMSMANNTIGFARSYQIKMPD